MAEKERIQVSEFAVGNEKILISNVRSLRSVVNPLDFSRHLTTLLLAKICCVPKM